MAALHRVVLTKPECQDVDGVTQPEVVFPVWVPHGAIIDFCMAMADNGGFLVQVNWQAVLEQTPVASEQRATG